MDRASLNYILSAFEIVEKDNTECRRSQALRNHNLLYQTKPRMQQDINIIREDDSAENSNAKTEIITDLKQEIDTKNAFVENQRKLIENQNDKIFKLNDEKERLQRDIKNLKEEMEMDRSRK